MQAGLGSLFEAIQLGYNEWEKTHIFPLGLDFAVGTAIVVAFSTMMADGFLIATGSYQVI